MKELMISISINTEIEETKLSMIRFLLLKMLMIKCIFDFIFLFILQYYIIKKAKKHSLKWKKIIK